MVTDVVDLEQLPAAFEALAHNAKAMNALARDGAAFTALSHQPAFQALAQNPNFAAALRDGSMANAIQQGQ